MYDFEIVNRLRLGLRQRFDSNSVKPSADGKLDYGLALLALVNELYVSKSSEDAYKVLQTSTGQLPSYEQVNELQIYSCIALDADELFRRVLESMVIARGYAGLSTDTEFISGKNVLIIEQSHLLSLNSGIQRVTRMIAKEFASNTNFILLSVVPDGSGFTHLTEREKSHLLQKDFSSPDQDLDENISPDTNLILSNCRILVPEVTKNKDFASRLRALGAFSSNQTFFIGYDLIPILAPEFVAPIEIESFAHYLLATTESTAVVCISNQTRDEFLGYFKARETVKDYRGNVETLLLPAPGKNMGLRKIPVESNVLSLENQGYFLCVGTIEPRKNQLKILSAFNELWARGGDQKIVFVGRISKLIESEFVKLAGNQLGRKVFHFEDISDSELDSLYDNAKATIQISSYEGFGLPVVESIIHCVPVVVNAYGVQNELSVGKGGYSVPDKSIESLVVAIDRLTNDSSLLSKLIEETSDAHFMSASDYAEGIQRVILKER
jgi:glycosyltransferase involved in cell wall biosynthesis